MGQPDSQLAMRIQGQIGFTWWLNQASGVRLAGTVAEDGGKVFIGAELQRNLWTSRWNLRWLLEQV